MLGDIVNVYRGQFTLRVRGEKQKKKVSKTKQN
jgi:hypothetical protein